MDGVAYSRRAVGGSFFFSVTTIQPHTERLRFCTSLSNTFIDILTWSETWLRDGPETRLPTFAEFPVGLQILK